MKDSSSKRETVHLVNVLCSEGEGSETFLVTFQLKWLYFKQPRRVAVIVSTKKA